MKKILFIAAASVALLVSSCQKENIKPQNTPNSFTLKQTFNYSQTLTIYDETGKYSVDYIVQADNKEVFDNGVNSFKNMRMKLLNENYVAIKKNASDITSENKPAIQTLDYSSTLFLKVENVNKGKAKGFELVQIANTKTNYNVTGFTHVFYILPEFANWYKVTNATSNTVLARDFYSNNGSSWSFSSQAQLGSYAWHDFSATNTPYRAIDISSYLFGKYIYCIVSIY